jgi:hypothetical protein
MLRKIIRKPTNKIIVALHVVKWLSPSGIFAKIIQGFAREACCARPFIAALSK